MPASSFDPARIDALVAEMEHTFPGQWHHKVQRCFEYVTTKPPLAVAYTDEKANVLRIKLDARCASRDLTGP
jgi:hypothetical protein